METFHTVRRSLATAAGMDNIKSQLINQIFWLGIREVWLVSVEIAHGEL